MQTVSNNSHAPLGPTNPPQARLGVFPLIPDTSSTSPLPLARLPAHPAVTSLVGARPPVCRPPPDTSAPAVRQSSSTNANPEATNPIPAPLPAYNLMQGTSSTSLQPLTRLHALRGNTNCSQEKPHASVPAQDFRRLLKAHLTRKSVDLGPSRLARARHSVQTPPPVSSFQAHSSLPRLRANPDSTSLTRARHLA